MTSQRLHFAIRARRAAARCGELTVRGRSTPTPAFMPVGTQGTVKGVPGGELSRLGYRAILANTYHLHLRPGEATVQALGGIHRFMDFPGIVLTDSGGYQVFSLAERRSLDADGVSFQSHLDGSPVRLTPESAMAVQHALDSDIAMVLDECPPAEAGEAELRRAVERSLAWARRSLDEHRRLSDERAVFGILQGGRRADLRAQMAAALTDLPFDGFALGGISVGEGPAAIRWAVKHCAPLLPEACPRYLMGVGSPLELVDAVQRGIDLFDCVGPTRNARNGYLYTRRGVYKARNAAHAASPLPVDESCGCLLCQRYTRAYLRHLFVAREMLGPILATFHNLTFFAALLEDLRRWIHDEEAVDLQWLDAYRTGGSESSPS